jgi:hypothetical protein
MRKSSKKEPPPPRDSTKIARSLQEYFGITRKEAGKFGRVAAKAVEKK